MEERGLVRCRCSETEHILIGVWEWEIGDTKDSLLGNGEWRSWVGTIDQELGISVTMIDQNGDGIARTPPVNSCGLPPTNEDIPVGEVGNGIWVVSEVEVISIRMCDGLGV